MKEGEIKGVKESGLEPLQTYLASAPIGWGRMSGVRNRDERVIDAAISILYALRYALSMTELPYGTVDINHVFVDPKGIVKLDLPEWRCVEQRKGETIKADMRGLYDILMVLKDHLSETRQKEFETVADMGLVSSDVCTLKSG